MSLVDIRREGQVCVLTLQREEKLNALSSALEPSSSTPSETKPGKPLHRLRRRRQGLLGRSRHQRVPGQRIRLIARYYAETGDVYEHIAALRVPTIAAIHGWCLGGGLELALAVRLPDRRRDGHLRAARSRARHPSELGRDARLVRMLGPAKAKELMLLAPPVRRGEAARRGLVTEVVPAGRALERSLEIGRELAELPPLAVQTAKQAADVMPEASREAEC